MDVLAGLFYRVRFRTNINKMVGIVLVCQPCCVAGGHLEASCESRMTGVWPSFRERQRERVQKTECAEDLAEGLLEEHRQDQYGMGQGHQWETTPPPPDHSIYMVYLSRADGLVGFSVEGCKGWSETCTNLHIHFVNHHV